MLILVGHFSISDMCMLWYVWELPQNIWTWLPPSTTELDGRNKVNKIKWQVLLLTELFCCPCFLFLFFDRISSIFCV